MRFTILPYRQLSAAANMAVDGEMMALARDRDSVCFRYYGWSEAAVTFGYSQPLETVITGGDSGGIARIRRETGGGLVDHRADLTYALALPRAHSAWSMSPADVYIAVHDALSRSLRAWGVGASLAPCPEPCGDVRTRELAAECFGRAEPGDVIETTTGRKLAGAALRRHASALLLQGSISRTDPLSMLDEPGWRRRFPALIAANLDCAPPIIAERWPDDLPAAPNVERFASASWNARR